jgi:hypothetical protein
MDEYMLTDKVGVQTCTSNNAYLDHQGKYVEPQDKNGSTL